jgi:hypothetical protein
MYECPSCYLFVKLFVDRGLQWADSLQRNHVKYLEVLIFSEINSELKEVREPNS